MTDKGDDLGDRMKLYEMAEAGRKTLPLLPILVRLDGRSFSKFTKDLTRPFDTNFHELMMAVASHVLDETDARIAYTQSDEISLVLYSDDVKSQLLFDGRIQKLVSTLAAIASVRFNKLLPKYLPAKAEQEPTFDCRVWMAPTKEEAANAILWRERDATKNAVSMAARSMFSHSELQDKHGSEMQAMMLKKDVNFNDYPSWFKRGTFIRKESKTMKPDDELISRLVKLGQGVPSVVTRSFLTVLEVPPFGKVGNRVGFIFDREAPVLKEEV